VNEGSGALLVVVVLGAVGLLEVVAGAAVELVAAVLGVLVTALVVGALAIVDVLVCEPHPASSASAGKAIGSRRLIARMVFAVRSSAPGAPSW
jgi:hypothetical protein